MLTKKSFLLECNCWTFSSRLLWPYWCRSIEFELHWKLQSPSCKPVAPKLMPAQICHVFMWQLLTNRVCLRWWIWKNAYTSVHIVDASFLPTNLCFHKAIREISIAAVQLPLVASLRNNSHGRFRISDLETTYVVPGRRTACCISHTVSLRIFPINK